MNISKKQALTNANVKSLLSIGADSKTIKGEKLNYLTGIVYLAPDTVAFKHINKKGTLCANAKIAGCASACLYSAGRGSFSNVQQSRINKSISLITNEENFLIALYKSIESLVNKASKKRMIPAIRLNGTSDVDYTGKVFTVDGKTANIFDHFKGVQFYDYTKNMHMLKRAKKNYTLTASYSAASTRYSRDVLDAIKSHKVGASVVFRGAIPNTFEGLPVINGDDTDLRFLDAKKHNLEGKAFIVGLYAKGKAKTDASGFVQGAI